MKPREFRFTRTAQLRERWFGKDVHPYRVMETRVMDALTPTSCLLDAGCGKTAPVLSRFRGHAARLIGIDLVTFADGMQDFELYRRDLADTGLEPESVDVIYSRSVFEHLEDPVNVLKEFRRILACGGWCFVLTANLWDYASLISLAVPNRFHPFIVSRTEGRDPEDVFPAHYRCNTQQAIRRCARHAGLELHTFEYLGQYPAYFLFSPVLFSLASAYERTIRRFRALHPLLGWVLFALRKPGPFNASATEQQPATEDWAARS